MARSSWRALMGRSRSQKTKESVPLANNVRDDDASDSSPPPSASTQLWPHSSLVWLLGFVIVVISGYGLNQAPPASLTGMWMDQLFSEYIPPGSTHVHLVQKRNNFLTQNSSEPVDLWKPPKSYGWKQCVNKKDTTIEIHKGESRYLQIFCSGGLFQLHICICNAVTVAWLLNAHLVVPHFLVNRVWKDPSHFEDIYDINHFISTLEEDIRIVRHIPTEYEWSTPEYYYDRCLERPNCFFYIPKHARKEWYLENVLPVLQSHGIVLLNGFTHKLSFEGLPVEATRLRCKTNFYALRFVKPILDLGLKLVSRIQSKAKHLHRQSLKELQSKFLNDSKALDKKQSGHFLGLHLRFEKDMIAYSNCYYGGGRAERQALAAFRCRMFRGPVRSAHFTSEQLRKNGSCPLTPEEVGLLLSGLGFRNTTPIYVAGKIPYGGEKRVKPLRVMFPHLENKDSLASKEELQWFLPYSNKLAALDFVVLLNSDAFLSNSAGNFPNVLTGYRTFFGPRKSIHPDKAALFELFSNASLKWDDFSSAVTLAHKDRQGAPCPRRERYSIFRYPAPDCMCRKLKET